MEAIATMVSAISPRMSYRMDVTFQLDWDPVNFIEDQGYDEEDEISRAITLTGTSTSSVPRRIP
jgi:hypothetical protein